MCNRKIVDTIPPCKIIRFTETISFLVESRLSKIMLMVNAAIYPNIKFFKYFTFKIPGPIYKSFKQFYLGYFHFIICTLWSIWWKTSL